MGKPGNKEQSSISNIFKRVPNYNYEKQGSEAIVPNIGGMGEQSSENVYMSDAENSPLQQAGFSPLNMGGIGSFVKPKPDAGITGAMGSDLRRQQYDDKGWAYDDTIAGDHEGAWQPEVDPATANVEEPAVAPVDEAPVEEVPADPTVDPNPEETPAPAPSGREGRIADLEQKITDTVGDQEDGTTSHANQRKAGRLSRRVGRMKQRQANKERRQARRQRVKDARKDPVTPKQEVQAPEAAGQVPEGPGQVPVEPDAPETAVPMKSPINQGVAATKDKGPRPANPTAPKKAPRKAPEKDPTLLMRSPITQRVQRYRSGYKS